MINIKIIFKLALPIYIISLLFSWEPYHRTEQLKYSNYTFDPSLIDSNTIISERVQIRSSLSHSIIGYLPYWEYYQYQDLNYNLLTRINSLQPRMNPAEFLETLLKHSKIGVENCSMSLFAKRAGYHVVRRTGCASVSLCDSLFAFFRHAA